MQDPNTIRKIIAAVAARPGERILEIGPGKGALTESLLESDCRLYVVEKDSLLAQRWKKEEANYPNFHCIEGDILEQDWEVFLPLDKIAANIPYNISRELLYKILHYHKDISEVFLLLQREFAEKLNAPAGEKPYGALSVLTQILAEIEILFSVPRTVFSPQPHVDSLFVHLKFKSGDFPLPLLKDCVQKAFSQRRKKLRNSLKTYYHDSLEQAFDWDSRADAIEAHQYREFVELLSRFPTLNK